MARGVWQHSVSKNDCERSAQENFGTLAHTKSKLDRNFIKIVLIQGFKAFLKGFRVWLVRVNGCRTNAYFGQVEY